MIVYFLMKQYVSEAGSASIFRQEKHLLPKVILQKQTLNDVQKCIMLVCVKALLILLKSNGFPACNFYVKEPQYFLVGGSTFTKGNMLHLTLET